MQNDEFRRIKSSGHIDDFIHEQIVTMHLIENNPSDVVNLNEFIDSVTYLNESYSLMDYANLFCGTEYSGMIMPSAFFESVIDALEKHSFRQQERLKDYTYLCINYVLTFSIDEYLRVDNVFKQFFDVLDTIKTQYY